MTLQKVKWCLCVYKRQREAMTQHRDKILGKMDSSYPTTLSVPTPLIPRGLLPTELTTTSPSVVKDSLFPLWRERHARESLSGRASRKEGVWKGHLGAKTPGSVAWDSSLLSPRRIHHHWTPGFLVSLETLSTCVGVKVGRVKISFISYKKNSPLHKVTAGAEAASPSLYVPSAISRQGYTAFWCGKEDHHIF